MLKYNAGPAWPNWPGRILILLALNLPLTASAMSAGKQIVDEALDASDANTMRVELRFIMRVNYLWHFPHAAKDEFLIAVQPINGLANYDLRIREHIRIPPQLTNIITDLYYDGTQPNNRFIVLETSRDVGISVKQGKDGRNLIIEFDSVAPEPASDCSGKATKQKE